MRGRLFLAARVQPHSPMSSPRLLHNIATLGVLQVANFVLTLVPLPYLTRVLGVETWGRLVFVQLITNYLVWVCNWGFYLNTTRKIAASRSNPAVVADVYTATLGAQWVLTMAAALVLVVLSAFVPFFSKDLTLYVCGIGLLIGNALMPFWFLNGMERMKDAAVIQIITKALAIPLFFVLVKESGDAAVFIAINAGCAMLMGVVTLAWIQMDFGFSYSLPGWKRMFLEVKEGAKLFAGSAWANLGAALAPTVLGSIAGPVELGYYNIADRVRGAATTILHPITHALFPRMCHLFAQDPHHAERLLKRSGTLVMAASAVISLTIFVLARHIVLILGGDDFDAAAGVLKWLALAPFLFTVSSFCTHQIIIPADKSNVYHSMTLATLCLTALMVIPAVWWKRAEGAAILTVAVEVVVMAIALIYVWRNNFFLKRAIL